MTLEPSRRGFLATLIGGAAAAKFVRIVPPTDLANMPGVTPASEIIEYDDTNPVLVHRAMAHVARGPLRLEHNSGFRYLTRSTDGMGVRLFFGDPVKRFYERPGGYFERRVVLVGPASDVSPNVMFVVTANTPQYVEVQAFDQAAGKSARHPFFVLVSEEA